MAASDEPSIVPRGVLPMRLCEVSVKPPPLFTHEKGEPWLPFNNLATQAYFLPGLSQIPSSSWLRSSGYLLASKVGTRPTLSWSL